LGRSKFKLRRVYVGHRGVGKTFLLARSQQYFPEVSHFDLDYEISCSQNRSPSEIFSQSGEAHFRKIEADVFEKIISQNENFVIACGAGFDPALIDSSIEVVFVSRLTDADGRIFLDRPRLNPNLLPLEESRTRFLERHERFLKRADQIYDMPEGIESINQIEKQILTGQVKLSSVIYTVQTRDYQKTFTDDYRYFELRNDILTDEQITQFKKNNPLARLMYSVRQDGLIGSLENFEAVDCDIRFASDFQWPGRALKVVSSHHGRISEAVDQLTDLKKKFEVRGWTDVHFKLCPQVESFEELIAGHEWQAENPDQRSFLPRSEDGRWAWYRLIKSYDQKLNYVKSSSEVADQPTPYEFLTLPPERPAHWGAVLGDPVYFSRSPEQHRAFFSEFGSFFTRIKLSESELPDVIIYLNRLGLKYAAVTSPLKEVLFRISDIQSMEANRLKSANTFIIENKMILVHNTDLDGFMSLKSNLKAHSKVAVWGGGGTLSMMRSVLPNAHYFSAQSGDLRDFNFFDQSKTTKKIVSTDIESENYDYLIWAAPRKPDTKWPDSNFKCKTVLDLNYTDFSMGLEYAAKNKLIYISGLDMFKEQARKQQAYWMQGVKS
jgi:shikimate 5-dehydrogenase